MITFHPLHFYCVLEAYCALFQQSTEKLGNVK